MAVRFTTEREYAFGPSVRLRVAGSACAQAHFDREYGPAATAGGAPEVNADVRFAVAARGVADLPTSGGHKTARWRVELGDPRERPLHVAISVSGGPPAFAFSLVQGYHVEPLVAVALARAGFVALPSAGVLSADGALVVMGRSGSGKSSVSVRALAGGRGILGDDQVVIASDGGCWPYPRRLRLYPDVQHTAPDAWRRLRPSTRRTLRLRGVVRQASRGFIAPSLAVAISELRAPVPHERVSAARLVVVERSSDVQVLTELERDAGWAAQAAAGVLADQRTRFSEAADARWGPRSGMRRSAKPRSFARGSSRCRSPSCRSRARGTRAQGRRRSRRSARYRPLSHSASASGIGQIVSRWGVQSDVRTLALLVATVAAAATAPVATTGPAEQVTTYSARLSGTVNPGGAATTYHFEYGTTSAYGLSSTLRNAGTGSEPVRVHATLGGLTSDTEYHYRVVAANGAGTAAGNDATLHTAAKPRPPGAATGVARPVGATSTNLHGTVVPNGAPTDYHFEYGTTLAFEKSTPIVSAGNGDSLVRVTVPIAGLRPKTRYHVRLVATNAAGRTVAADRPFTTLRQPTGVSIAVAPARPVWGTAVSVTGMVAGEGIDHIPVALERLDFPFTSAFAQFGPTVKADGSGRFKFTLPAVYSTTRLRVSTRTRVSAASPPATVPVALKVGLRMRRVPHRRAELSGAVWPATPHGRALLQRQGRRGRWIPVVGKHLTRLTHNRSRFRFKVRLRRHPRNYRVVVNARDGGAHVPGRSRTRRLPPPAR